jgi:DNA-binding NtrC family response regulator
LASASCDIRFVGVIDMGKPVALLVAATHLLHPLRAELHARSIDTLERGHGHVRAALASGRRLAVAIVACEGMTPTEGIAAARHLRQLEPLLPIIVVADPGSEDLAIAAIKAGVADYFKAPLDPDVVARAAAQLASVPDDTTDEPTGGGLDAMVGVSQVVQETRQHIRRLAASDTSVLVTGETGTGKELVAHLLHRLSARCERPFVCINCAAIPDTLLESELFGWERGAFTGASSAHAGHLAAASGGTVLLDEIGEMTPYAQAKILRALDRREVYRLGGTHRVPLDIRVVAATNQNLEQLIGESRFRRDLYYRLHVARISLPPLRERREDIPLLLNHYVRELNRRFNRHIQGFTGTALQELIDYDWPGNVREVRNVLEGVFAELPPGGASLLETPPWLRRRLATTTVGPEDERTRLLSALMATNWNVSETARQLHWCRMTLYRKIAKYQLARARDPHDILV